jgi:hypothetical protein
MAKLRKQRNHPHPDKRNRDEAATRYGASKQCYPESDLFEPRHIFLFAPVGGFGL